MTVLLIGILLSVLLLIVVIIKASKEPETIFQENNWETRYQSNGKLLGKSGTVRKR